MSTTDIELKIYSPLEISRRTFWWGIRFVELSAYDSLKAENERLRQELEEVKAKYDELKSYLPKVPTQPYEKELAEENERLRQELATANEFRAKWQKAFRDSEARAEKLVVALKFYSDRKKWDEILMLEGAVFGNCEGDPAIVFDAEDDSPWEVARNALAEWGKK